MRAPEAVGAVDRQTWFVEVSWTRLDVPTRAAALTLGSLDTGDGARCGVGRLARVLGITRYRAGVLLRHLAELGLIAETDRDCGGEAVFRLCLPARGKADSGSA